MIYTATATYTDITCCNSKCGITFMVPVTWQQEKRRDHSFFYCPNGHHQHYPGKSEEEKLRDQLAREKHNAEQAQAHAEYMTRAFERADRRRAAMKGQVTKIKNRVSKGVCPCCNRTFQDLQRHMQSQHPNWTPETDAE